MEKNVLDLVNLFFDEKDYSNLFQTKKDYFVDKNEKEYVIEMALPGYDKEDLNISFEKDSLIISYVPDEKKDGDKWKKKLNKVYTVSDGINNKEISAT